MKNKRWNCEKLDASDKRELKRLAKGKTFSAFSLEVGIERAAFAAIMKRGTAKPENIQVIKNFLSNQQQAA